MHLTGVDTVADACETLHLETAQHTAMYELLLSMLSPILWVIEPDWMRSLQEQAMLLMQWLVK
jgi:hypothetical protein